MRISDWSSDVCSSDLDRIWLASEAGLLMPLTCQGAARYCKSCLPYARPLPGLRSGGTPLPTVPKLDGPFLAFGAPEHCSTCNMHSRPGNPLRAIEDRKSTRLNSVTNAHLVCRLLLEKKKIYQ